MANLSPLKPVKGCRKRAKLLPVLAPVQCSGEKGAAASGLHAGLVHAASPALCPVNICSGLGVSSAPGAVQDFPFPWLSGCTEGQGNFSP